MYIDFIEHFFLVQLASTVSPGHACQVGQAAAGMSPRRPRRLCCSTYGGTAHLPYAASPHMHAASSCAGSRCGSQTGPLGNPRSA